MHNDEKRGIDEAYQCAGTSSNRVCAKCGASDFWANGRCAPCGRAKNAAWKSANKDRISASGRAYREENADKVKAAKAAWHAKNAERINADKRIKRVEDPERFRSAQRESYLRNKAKARARAKAYYRSNAKRIAIVQEAWRQRNIDLVKAAVAKWASDHRDRSNQIKAAWRKRNSHTARVVVQNRRARRRINGGRLSPDIAKKLFKLQRGLCPCCGFPLGRNYHIDHIVPIAMGGPNTDENVQLMRQRCNIQKSAKHPIDFMQTRGFLL